MAVRLGAKVKDTITGFEGVATSRTEFLYGCVRVHVEPQALHDGKPVEAQYFDEQRLVGVSAPVVSSARSGGDRPLAPRRADPPTR